VGQHRRWCRRRSRRQSGTLDEEKATDEALTEIAESAVNAEAEAA
jgi:ferritin-like metal-binding protein YciE